MAPAIGGVYNSGILAAPKNARKIFSYAVAPPEIVMKFEALRAVCDDFDVPLAAAEIGYPTCHSTVTCVVMGAKTPAQVRQNAGPPEC